MRFVSGFLSSLLHLILILYWFSKVLSEESEPIEDFATAFIFLILIIAGFYYLVVSKFWQNALERKIMRENRIIELKIRQKRLKEQLESE